MVAELPTGTVTFLFTDVEGSTQLLGELGENGYAAALHAHREVIRSALAEYGGAEVDTQGDAFFCAFASARAAIACARSVQESLAGGPIQVRMGVHTGEALLSGDHYVGMDVHRAARIGACGHGGQVVVSPATAALLEPGSFELKELGVHRLKDLSAPVTLYQLGDGEFPALSTLFRTNLPVPATPFLGREDELRELIARAQTPEARLLTLTGPGGTGKTRFALQLAAELADDFPHGVRWVPLAALGDGAVVASAVARTVDAEEEAGASLAETIARTLADKRLLLLLDNCEHVLDSVAPLVATVLAGCPRVLVLATSREPLDVGGEHVHAVEPLLPADAVLLFEARARAAGAAVDAAEVRAAVEELCARLDNLPLAVELAAARTAALPPQLLLERLSSRIDLLRGPRDADERQRTLRATIAWSHDLLVDSEQRAFRRLSVFSAGGTLDAVENVCDADLEDVLSLVAKSLVRQTERPGREPRYWMLETIREFAASMLEDAGETAAYRDRHVDWFAAVARDAANRLVGRGSGRVLAALEDDLDNLRAAFRWARDHAPEANGDAASRYGAAVVAAAHVLAPLHLLHGRYQEGEDVIEAALELGPRPLDAALLRGRLGRILRQGGRPTEGLESYLEGERVLERETERGEDWWSAWIAVKLGHAHQRYFQADLDALERVIDELRPVVAERGTPAQQLDFMYVLLQNAYRRERYTLTSETETLVREVHRRALAAEASDAEFTLGFGLLWREKLDESSEAFQRGLAASRERGDALIETRCLVYDALARRRLGDVDGVRARLRELERLEQLHGYDGLFHAGRAWVAYRDEDLDGVEEHAAAAFADWGAQHRSGPTVFQWTARFPLLAAQLARGSLDGALEQVRAMLDPVQQPLPEELEAVLRDAVEDADGAALARAVELARASGHA